MNNSAAQVRRWLRTRAVAGKSSKQIDKLVRTLLRTPAHVQLKDDVVYVRIAKPWTWRARKIVLMKELFVALNDQNPHTMDRFQFRVQYCTNAVPGGALARSQS